ncbi:MAG: hypothetical protein AB7F40_06215 [Victivallaceae bacterium]|nr:hypothetical protein [Victivallaceae bacterium]
MLKPRFNQKIILKIPDGFADGKRKYRTVRAWALSMPEVSAETSGLGSRSDDTVFLITSPEAPSPGTLVVDDGGTRELGVVKICKDLDGKTVAYRCRVK